MKQLEAEFLKLPIEDQTKLMEYAMGRLLEKRRVDIGGRSVSLRKLTERVLKDKEIMERGGFKDTFEEDDMK